jgi:ribonuclease P/MRP protein subunit POP5
MVRPLLPTLRQKKRYILFEVIAKDTVPQNVVLGVIQATAKECVGLWGVGALQMKLIEFKQHRGIVRVDHRHVDTMRAILGVVKIAGEQSIVLRTLKVSGSLKKLR